MSKNRTCPKTRCSGIQISDAYQCPKSELWARTKMFGFQHSLLPNYNCSNVQCSLRPFYKHCLKSKQNLCSDFRPCRNPNYGLFERSIVQFSVIRFSAFHCISKPDANDKSKIQIILGFRHLLLSYR